MRYESEVLYDLMKRDGLLNPSQSNLPYESELKEKYVNDVKGAYPKLIDYCGEWLNYAYENPIGEFPYETLTNVTEATINNVVPYAYKSAILSGRTLVNLFNKSQDSYTIEPTNKITFKSDLYKMSTTYLIKFDVVSSNTNNKLMVQYYLNGQWLANYELNIKLGINKIVITSISNHFNTIRLYYNPSYGSETIELKDIMLIEYQDGMENWDIPYFEGMQSVKMPVLTTNNSNLVMPSDFERGYIEESTGQNNPNGYQEFCRTIGFIDVKGFVGRIYGGAKYNGTTRSVLLFGYDKDKNLLKTSVNFIDVTSDIRYIRANIHTPQNPSDPTKLYDIYISSKNSYEPYKSNILTTNEDVTLRSNGNVCDELDLLAGKLTQRIGEDGEVLSQEVVKTVDLTIVNQDGDTLSKLTPIEGTMHLRTDGTPLKPTFSGELPVEAITQNLASFIE